jgi:hypothetical protein
MQDVKYIIQLSLLKKNFPIIPPQTPQTINSMNLDLSQRRAPKLTKAQRAKQIFFNFLPVLKWLPQYDAKTCLRGDISGGIIIGLILICQTMAHAAIATTMTVQGPYCAVVL